MYSNSVLNAVKNKIRTPTHDHWSGISAKKPEPVRVGAEAYVWFVVLKHQICSRRLSCYAYIFRLLYFSESVQKVHILKGQTTAKHTYSSYVIIKNHNKCTPQYFKRIWMKIKGLIKSQNSREKSEFDIYITPIFKFFLGTKLLYDF